MTTDDRNRAGDDPFERAMAREEAYRAQRSRASLGGFPLGIFKVFRLVALGALIAWAGLLTAHWRFLGEPRWLAILHTMVFGIACIYLAAMTVLFTVMRKRPETFGLAESE